MPEGFLFGCRKLLTGWSFNSKATKVDTDELTLKIGEELVLQASVVQNQFVHKFHKDWESWVELQSRPELKALVEKASQALSRSKGSQKGLGKGPGGGTGR